MPQSPRLLLGSFLALTGVIKAWLHSVAVSTLAVIEFALMLSAYVSYNRQKKTISAFGWS